MKRYGVPYKGSKNKIAKKIIDYLPSATNFYDLFAGGCAITDCAMQENKYKNYIINDIETDITEMFIKATKGEYKNENRWISRDKFYKLKDIDPYIRYCWSFGNNGRDYIYSKNIEPWKKALHYARVLNDTSLLKEFGINSDGSRADIKAHHEEYKNKYIEWQLKKDKIDLCRSKQSLENLQNLDRLQSLESLERLESLQGLESLERFNVDYKKIKIKPDSVIYCDIPYKNTNKYSTKFDYERFYKWACEQTQPIFISEYWMPEDRFECVLEIKAQSTLQSGAKSVIEKLFVPKK